MPFSPIHTERNPNDSQGTAPILPHVGMRKVKSVLAIFVGFLLWQLLRLFLPGLEVHPIFIYIYGMIEMRETSEKTRDYGRMRILATFVAIAAGLPMMILSDILRPMLPMGQPWMEIAFLVLGALLVLSIAERVGCRIYCGLAAAIYLILMISHFESSMYLYSFMRAFQTILGVLLAWVINVKLFPYPPVAGSFGDRLLKRMEHRGKKSEDGTAKHG